MNNAPFSRICGRAARTGRGGRGGKHHVAFLDDRVLIHQNVVADVLKVGVHFADGFALKADGGQRRNSHIRVSEGNSRSSAHASRLRQ